MECPRCKREVPDDAALCCYCARVFIKKKPAKNHLRGNGMGYAMKRGNTWTAYLTLRDYRDSDGKRHQVRKTKGGFKTKNEALDYIPTLKNEGKRDNKTVPSLLEYWAIYEAGEFGKLSPNKRTSYKIAWKKLEPLWYHHVNTLTVSDLRAIVDQKAKTYYPAKDMKTVLTHLFKLAGADGWVNKDLPEYIVLPELNETERETFTKEEQEALWRLYEEGDRRAALPLIMIYTGMMPGEMRDLKVDMIDLEAQQIAGVGLKTKVRKKSLVYLPDAIVPVLIEEMKASTSKNGYVWPRTTDKFYKTYYEALEAAGCRRLETYCCRHTTATALSVSENVAPQTIKKFMRWSTTKMLDRYSHPDDSDVKEAANRLKR